MKTIKIGARELQYQTLCDEGLDGSDVIYTEFYEGTETYKAKKYLIFGPVIEKEVPKLLFTIYEDSNNERLTKGWWREKILRELELVNRKEELERGELC
jgi:hypothetical protein